MKERASIDRAGNVLPAPNTSPQSWLPLRTGRFRRIIGNQQISSRIKSNTSRAASGLVNQSVITVCIAVLCVTSHELMKRKRRGNEPKSRGSVESWDFG
jgi:hypothetical protein